MTYKDFEWKLINISIPNRGKYISRGQQLMIYLHEIRQELYNKITATEFDCFYVEGKMEKTLDYLKQNW